MGLADRPRLEVGGTAQDGAGEDVRRLGWALAEIGSAGSDEPSLVAAIARAVTIATDAACEVRLDQRPHALALGALGGLAFGRALTAAEHARAAIVAAHGALALSHARGMAELATARAASANRVSRFARLGESGALGVLVSAGRNTIVEVNDTLGRMIGFSREELMREDFDWSARTPAEYRDIDRQAVLELRETGVAALREKEYLRKDGTRIWVIVGSAMVEGTKDECISFYVDVTERKRAEAEARQLREEAELARRMAAVVEAADDAIIGVALDGTITSWNRGAKRIFGYSASEAIGSFIRMLTPPGRDGENAAIRERMRAFELVQFDTVRRRKDGVDIDVALTISPITDASGAVTAVSIVGHDITARRAAADQLARARDEAEAASRELEAFSYSVAHDLRAPLRGISGFAKVLLDDYADKLDAEGRDCLDEVRGGAQKMAALIDALLSLSRVTRSELRRERVDLAALVRASVAELAAAEPARRVALTTPPFVPAMLDPRLARSLVDNLVSNSWKFTRDAIDARIELGVRPEDGAVFIRDNGAGFDMAHAAKLFSPFQRLHTVHEFPGTGIGLATVQRIVMRHGGRIWAEAQVGRGATFTFVLPPEPGEASS